MQSNQGWTTRFFAVWTGQAVSLLGSRLVQFALIWYLTARTESATVLALATLVGMLPQIMISPLAGVLVDRWNRQRVMIAADSMIALATVGLAVLFALDIVAVWHVYVLLFVRALGGAFHWPAMQASTTLMVPNEHLSRIGGMNQTLSGIAGIAMPPLGALLIEWDTLSMQGILAIDVITALVAIVPLLFLTIPQPAERATAADGGRWQRTWVDMRAGWMLLLGWPGLMFIVLIGTVIHLLVSPGVALLPLLVTDHFGGAARELAWLEAAGGIGMVLGGVILSVWGGFKRRIVTAMAALVLDGIAILVVGVAPSDGIIVALVALFAAGLVEPMILGSIGAIAMAIVPPDMQGRIFGLAGAMGAAAAPLGLIVAGPVSDAIGVQVWFLVGGVAVAVMGAMGFLLPAVMAIEELGAPVVES